MDCLKIKKRQKNKICEFNSLFEMGNKIWNFFNRKQIF